MPWEHPRDLARALLWAAQSRAPVLSMSCLQCLLAQCDPREKSGYKSKGIGERKEQKCPSLAPVERCASVPTAFSAPGGEKCTTPQDSWRQAPSIWTWQHPDATIASPPDLILPLLSPYWDQEMGTWSQP